MRAIRAEDGSFAMIYQPENQSVTVDLSRISGTRKRVQWYNPRTGEMSVAEGQKGNFTPPKKGRDWVLVLEGNSMK